MRVLKNSGTDRLIDLLEPKLQKDGQLDLITPEFSLFAFSALQSKLESLKRSNIVLPAVDGELKLLGNEAGCCSGCQAERIARSHCPQIRTPIQPRQQEDHHLHGLR